MPYRRWCLLLVGLICELVGITCELAGLSYQVVQAADVEFERTLAPLLAKRCLSCHAGPDAQGGLDLTSRETVLRGGASGPAVVPGQLEHSLLWQRIAAEEMPPKHPLPDAERQQIAAWVAAGAPWTGGAINPLQYSSEERAGFDWWSLQPLERPPIPSDTTAWSVNPVDSFVLQQLTRVRLSPNPPADKRVLIRRLWFDLLGIPPRPPEIEEFLQDDRPDAYERLVDRCLSSPHYGERWARHWLDVVRFGESNGFERDLPRPHAWHYRDWVIAALNADLPYDEFARWQLAGDTIAPDEPAAAAALGFLVAGPHDTVVPVVERMRQQMRQDELEDIVGVVGQTFLGLTVNCARCHDHKFDPISSTEYYRLASALSGVDHGERDVVPPQVTHTLEAWSAQIAALTEQLHREAEPHRRAILEERLFRPTGTPVSLPEPLADWDFTRDLQDRQGRLPGQPHGQARLTPSGLELDGQSFVVTPPLPQPLTEKTLEVRVRLADLSQRGGAAISVQTLNGSVFDAVVFGEQEPRKWMAGSDNFVRTKSFQGPDETEAAEQTVILTLVYRADGVIAAYRNGQPYGQSYQSQGPVRFEAGQAQIVFGLRHSPPGGNRLLRGTIAAARVYPRALSAEEVSASAQNITVTEAEILARLSPDERAAREQRTRQLAELRHKHAELARNGPIKMYTAVLTQPRPQHVLRRGNVADLGDVVAPGGLSAIRTLSPDFGLPPDAVEYQRRAQLARWITDRRNPLFARVMVNRLWHYHFGAGLVESPNDLGFHGGKPSHPELLDWLACELMAANYSLKHLHRLLVSSATYRQASTFRGEAAAVDAQNRWLWRMSPRRLDAECVRDALLVATGDLNPELGGKGYSDFHSYFFKGTQFYDPVDPTGPESQRRTIYRMWARGGRNPLLDTFDCPDPSTTTPRRSVTTTPLQALSLMNHSFILRMSQRLAERLQREADGEAERIQRAYWLLYGRPPQADELQLAQEFAARWGLAETCRGLMNGAEFLYVD
uniref:DUF1553 domain-containing protein n=1 Tax=Schlesneria paludicola TaxID=360056 RepID=A0A7C4QSP3_9PLAN